MARKISYDRLWKLLIDKKSNKPSLRKAIDMSPNTLTRMRKEQTVSLELLLRICDYLNCDIGDIVEAVKVPDEQ